MNAGSFNNNHVSTGDLNRPRSPEVRKPLACFLVLFARRKKNVKTSPLKGISRFCKPRISVPQPQLRTATIKTFLRKLRGYANLESAHKTTTSHKPNYILFSALRRCPVQGSTPCVQKTPFREFEVLQTSIPSAAAAASHK